MKFGPAVSILATTAAIWTLSGPACETSKDAFAPEGVADQISAQSAQNRSNRPVGSSDTAKVIIADAGVPRPNVKVVFTPNGMADSARVSADTVTTDNAGFAQVLWTYGRKPGAYQMTVRVVENPSLSLTFSTDVIAGPLSKVTVPGADTVDVNATLQLAATTSDSYNNPVTGTVTWSSLDQTVATVDNSGLVSGKLAGTARIVATAGAAKDTTVVTVRGNTPVTTITVAAGAQMALKRLAAGTTQSFQGLYVGDHEANGDKAMQGFILYSLQTLPATATVASAKLTVSRVNGGFEGNPFLLGPLHVERTAVPELNEGALSISAISVMTSTQETATVDITPLVQQARAAGETSIWLRLRFLNVQNNNGAIDYGEFAVSSLELKY